MKDREPILESRLEKNIKTNRLNNYFNQQNK